MRRLSLFLIYFNSIFLLCLAGFFFKFIYSPGEDHLGAIALNGDKTWYMNFRRATSTQALDRDILYHNIGGSLSYAKKADIIIIGHSMALFGIDWRMIDQFAKDHNVKIYNMSSAGDASGEFLLRVIEKYKLKPSIWIINADDHERSYFSQYLSDLDKGEALEIVSYNRWHAYKNIVSKNIKWKIELTLRRLLPKSAIDALYPDQPIFNYRSILDGNWNNDEWPKYTAKNAFFRNVREPNCHAKQEEFALADQFIRRLKTGDVILTLVPHINSCRPRVQEIANHLKVPFLSVSWQDESSFDGGGHLDKMGAQKFTKEMLRQLASIQAFKKLEMKNIALANDQLSTNASHMPQSV